MPGPAGPPPFIPYAPPEAAPGMNPQNTGLRPAGYNGYPNPAVTSNNPGARATVLVKLPPDARLYAESRALSLTGAERKFVSPELPGGQEFRYRFRVEYERDGETVSVTKKVPVRAGGNATVEFTDLVAKAAPERNPEKNLGTNPERNAGGPANPGSNAVAATPTANPVAQTPASPASVIPSAMPTTPAVPTSSANAAERATITVKLPAGATLYVDDRKSLSNESVRQFSTPPLPAGRDFAYLMRAEIVRNGQTETFTQKVPFRAGERVEVDFTNTGR